MHEEPGSTGRCCLRRRSAVRAERAATPVDSRDSDPVRAEDSDLLAGRAVAGLRGFARWPCFDRHRYRESGSHDWRSWTCRWRTSVLCRQREAGSGVRLLHCEPRCGGPSTLRCRHREADRGPAGARRCVGLESRRSLDRCCRQRHWCLDSACVGSAPGATNPGPFRSHSRRPASQREFAHAGLSARGSVDSGRQTTRGGPRGRAKDVWFDYRPIAR